MSSDTDVYTADEGDRQVERSPRGRYVRFDIRLGSGAYKNVYKAYDIDQGIDVAWNAIDIGVLPASEKTRIIQEVQLLQKLEHKNIINFYGSWFSKEKNQVVFITEIMTSGTLKSYIKRVQFVKWKIIKRWCVQILEGLNYLHTQNPPVIHRDLKCDNIFINGNTGDLRIGDLGLSTQLAVQKSRAQSVLGTPEFMAPELYDESYDEKVDIYAFGMCVLEMVTKEVPYSECVNPAQIYKKVTAGIRPRGMLRIVSQAAREFIELCLSRGNGQVDVSAAYLLEHPFLKASDDDNDMVQVLSDDELQQQEMAAVKPVVHPEGAPKALSFAAELNMDSAPKMAIARKDSAIESATTEPPSVQKPAQTLKLPAPEALATVASQTSETSSNHSAVVPAEEKTGGQRYIVPTKVGYETDGAVSKEVEVSQASSSSLPPLPHTNGGATAATMTTALEPVVDEPMSGQKNDDNHVEAFLSTMAGNEGSIRNSRIALMGGRGHRIEIDDNDETVEASEVHAHVEEAIQEHAISPQPTPSQTSPSPSTVSTVEAPVNVSPPVSRPASAPRIRAKRYEIRANNDPSNPRNILLNLRIAIDGKSKEIKFPFNFFTESPHEVACELAVDVGILEPDLEDITDSISFLVTESKINNLADLEQDIWDEAPEPHSFSSKPLPLVSKMTFMGQQVVSITTQPPTDIPLQQPVGLTSAHPLLRSTTPVGKDVALPLVPSSIDPSTLRDSSTLVGGASSNLERSISTPAARMPRASSELFQTDEYISSLVEQQERGASLGTSVSDPNFLRAVRNFEDRLKMTKSSYDEQETRMEEKYQSEIERLRNMMTQLNEKTQRATMARNERERAMLLGEDFPSDSLERLTAFSEDSLGLRAQQLTSIPTGNGASDTSPPSSLAVRRYTSADPRLEVPLSPSHVPVSQFETANMPVMTTVPPVGAPITEVTTTSMPLTTSLPLTTTDPPVVTPMSQVVAASIPLTANLRPMPSVPPPAVPFCQVVSTSMPLTATMPLTTTVPPVVASLSQVTTTTIPLSASAPLTTNIPPVDVTKATATITALPSDASQPPQ